MRPARSSLLIVLLGVLLLANGLYVYPENVSHEREYEVIAEPVHEAEWPTGEFGITTIHDCAGGVASEDCALVRHLAEQAAIRVEHPGDVYEGVTNESEQLPEFFSLNDGYYQRTASLEDGALVVSMKPMDRERVLRATAENVSEVRDVYQRAVENDTVRTGDELHQSRLLVADGDRIYRVRTSGPIRGEATGWGWTEPGQEVIRLLRLLGWVGGIGLLWYAGYRYANRN